MDPLTMDDPRSLGQYRLLRRLGEGGMGLVYLGRSPGGRTVAVKVVRPELAGDPDFRGRFAREVDAARAVGGEYTAPVVDADPDAAVPWLATAYVLGPSLDDAVARFGPLPEESLRGLGAGLAEALVSVHGAGLIHRDLKPSNVLLSVNAPRVIDFGIARAIEGGGVTRTGLIVGSPGFMSPEQASGQRVTAASDIFSLGAVLVFAATGRLPFGDGGQSAQLYQVVHGEADLTGVPESLLPVIRACLAKDPAARPAPRQLAGPDGAGAILGASGTWLPPALASAIIAHASMVMELDAPPSRPAATAVDDPKAGPAATSPNSGAEPSRRRLVGTALGAAGAFLASGGAAYAITRQARKPAPAPTRAAGEPPTPDWRSTSAEVSSSYNPTPHGDRVLFASDSHKTVALNESSGHQVWQAACSSTSDVPLVSRGLCVGLDEQHSVVGINIADGRQTHQFAQDDKHGVTDVLAADDNLVYCLGEDDKNKTLVMGVDLQAGSLKWSLPAPGSSSDDLAAALSQDVLVYQYGDSNNKLEARSTRDGRHLWKASFKGTIKPFTPIIHRGTVLARQSDTRLAAYDLETGSVKWTLANPNGAQVSSMAANNTAGYITRGKQILSVDLQTGKEIWALTVDELASDYLNPTVTASDNTVYVAELYTFGIHAVDARTGRLLWTYKGQYHGKIDQGAYAMTAHTGKLYAAIGKVAYRLPGR